MEFKNNYQKKQLIQYAYKTIKIFLFIITNHFNLEAIYESNIIIEKNYDDNLSAFSNDLKEIEFDYDIANLEKKLNHLTLKYIQLINSIIGAIKNNGIIELYQINKLASLFFIFKIIKSNNGTDDYYNQIDNLIKMNLNNIDSFNNILCLIDEIDSKDIDKKDPLLYIKKISFSNIKDIKIIINSFFLTKLNQFEQYNIQFTYSKKDDEIVGILLEQIEIFLRILKKSESFEENARFFYYNEFEGKDKLYLDIINTILNNCHKKPLESLEEIKIDLLLEELEFSKKKNYYLIKKENESQIEKEKFEKDLNFALSKFEKLEKDKEEYNQKYKNFNEAHNKLNKDYDNLKQIYINLKKNYKHYDKNLNKIKNEKLQLNRNYEILIDRTKILEQKQKNIEYRDIDSKIIDFFIFQYRKKKETI